jgi:hypothetical protein
LAITILGRHLRGGADIPAEASAPLSVAKEDGDEHKLSTSLLKILFLGVGLGLALSAALGLWIGLTQTRSRRTAWFLLVGGVLLPVGLLLI